MVTTEMTTNFKEVILSYFEREKNSLFDDRNDFIEKDDEQDLSTNVDIEENEGGEEWQ